MPFQYVTCSLHKFSVLLHFCKIMRRSFAAISSHTTRHLTVSHQGNESLAYLLSCRSFHHTIENVAKVSCVNESAYLMILAIGLNQPILKNSERNLIPCQATFHQGVVRWLGGSSAILALSSWRICEILERYLLFRSMARSVPRVPTFKTFL